MKKILLASTAIVGFAGAAAAEVSISGSAEMGVAGSTGADTQFFQSIDVRFKMSGETDGGLSFGAQIDLDDAVDMSNAGRDTIDEQGFSDFTVFISGDWGTLTLGDTDGALDWALTEAGNVGNPGSIADDETAHAGYVGSYLDGNGAGDGQILRYDYSFGDFSFAISAEDDATGGVGPADMGYALGFKYSVDFGGGSLGLGLGYQQNVGDTISITGVSATYASDAGFSIGAVYADWDDNANVFDANWGIGMGYTTGAISLHLNYGVIEFVNGTSNEGYGLAAAYDLGGGASLHLGYGYSDPTGPNNSTDTYSFGVAMSF